MSVVMAGISFVSISFGIKSVYNIKILSRLSEINVNFVCNRARYRTASAGVLDMIDVVDN